ncbi:MAG: alpha/beta hydrolase [Dehalococcoidia bacterium]
MTDSFADINGLRLRYRVGGAGPLALFGHGLLGSIEQLDDQAPGLLARLQEDVRLLVYDARGHGQSTGPEDSAQYTWETLGLDMCAFVEHAGERSAILGGASMGAAAALWAGVERPHSVRALVLMLPPPLGFPSMRGPDEQQALAVLDLLAAAVQNFGLEKTVELARTLPGFAPTPEEAEMRAGWLLAQNPLALTHAIRGLVQAPIHDPERYREINAPVLVIAQEGDGLHPVRAARLLAENVPHARLAVAPSPGWWWSHQDDLMSELRAFMTAIG